MDDETAKKYAEQQDLSKWKEIIDICNNGDPEYSFKLFKEYMGGEK